MLYKKNTEQKLDTALFQNPTSEYRGAPFWSWNMKLDKELLLEQVDDFKRMGMGGFHMHCRTGLDTEYMGDEFMDIVKACHEKAVQEGMLTWLYDEDRWPSGFAGGKVTEDEQYRIRYLIFTPFLKTPGTPYAYHTRVAATSHGGGRLLAKYKITLQDGYLASYEQLEPDEPVKEGDNIWYAYLETGPDNPWYNNQAYVNTLDPEAIRAFINCTHEKYKELLGDEFGKTVPAIFSDEPQMAYKCFLSFAEEKKDVMMPFSEDCPDTFKQAYGLDLMAHLPELFWELPGGRVSRIRYLFHDHLGERFTSAAFDTMGNWCKANNLIFTGHLMNESSLYLQTVSMGDAMRCYRNFELPGIDMLCDRREFNTAKQAESIAHQYGREGILSEEYGVTNWDFDFRRHKLQGDWQAALGVTVRVHHLAHAGLAGEAKRDYPASIGYQSPWYDKYSLIEDHFSRLNTALTRGVPIVRAGVIHPVESYWLHFGPSDQTVSCRHQMDENFERLTEWLLTGLIDFDFISESLLPGQYKDREDKSFGVGEMAYDTVIVPGCETLRKTTFEALKKFHEKGGNIIFIGKPAAYLEAEPTGEVREFAKACRCVSMERKAVLDSLEDTRMIDIRVVENTGPNTIKHEQNPFADKGERTDNLIYQLRQDKENKWLFICNAFPVKNQDIPCAQKVKIIIDGLYNPVCYDTLSGCIQPVKEVEYINGKTVIYKAFHYHDSLLLKLDDRKRREDTGQVSETGQTEDAVLDEISFTDKVPVVLSEPNVVLFDIGEYQFDDEPWQPAEELLRIDNKIREMLGYALRMADVAQPWTDKTIQEEEHILRLRFFAEAKVEIPGCELALEELENTRIFWNNKEVKAVDSGWFIDKCIRRVPVGTVVKGINELVLEVAYRPKTNIEYCYLLGDFGVELKGGKPVITEAVKALGFGDWTTQGLPFYAGNITYRLDASGHSGDWTIKTPKYRAPLLTAKLDDGEAENLVFAPYEISWPDVSEGKHTIELTACGCRVNTLGALHNTDEQASYYGPDAWRSSHDRWTYGYMLKPSGILLPPVLQIKETKK